MSAARHFSVPELMSDMYLGLDLLNVCKEFQFANPIAS